MVNNTAERNERNKKIGKGAGKNDATRLTITSPIQTEQELKCIGKVERRPAVELMAGEFISIKAYNGGNPNKAHDVKEDLNKVNSEEFVH